MWRSYQLPHFFVMYKEKNLQIIYIFANKKQRSVMDRETDEKQRAFVTNTLM